ncbi:MAG: glycoside hydrolase family 57 protein [Prevotella sp.]|nr:glycoside hydrolase family 57 protein [Prevotella sp.]
MKTICMYFEIHQITHLKRYRFFDIGTDHYYYDDYENERSITYIAENSYMPALSAIQEMIRSSEGAFKVAFSLSGVGMEQLEMHAPQVLDKLQELNSTGCVEFLTEPYSHGLAGLANEESFKRDIEKMSDKIEQYFGKRPTVMRNSSLIYTDDIGAQVAALGYKGMLTEGAKHVLGWKSPHFVYNCNLAPSLKLLLRDVNLSDDISLRFSNTSWDRYPLFADTYMNDIASCPESEQVVNIFMELSALGIAQPLSSNILEFLKALPACAKERGLEWATPSEVFDKFPSVGAIDVPDTLSWVDEERDCSVWLGNQMQREAFNKLYSVADRLLIAKDPRLLQDWDYLQASNNFRFMTTKPSNWWIDRGIYDGAFDAFTNYMNILGDFISRVRTLYGGIDNEELENMLTTITNQGKEIETKTKEIERLQARLAKYEAAEDEREKAAKKPAAKKPAAKKPAAKKAVAKAAEEKK